MRNNTLAIENHMIIVLITVITHIFLLFLCNLSTEILLSFLFNVLLLALLGTKAFFNFFNPMFVVTTVFYYLFFIVAPVLQLNQNSTIFTPTNYKFRESTIIYTNMLVSLSYIFIYFSMNYFAKNPIKKRKVVNLWLVKNVETLSLVILSFTCTLLFVIYTVSLKTNLSSDSANPKLIGLIISKYFGKIPFFVLLFYLCYKKEKAFLITVLLFILTLATVNPFFEKRNAIGTVYLTLFFFSLQKFMTSNLRLFSFTFILFVIFFPLSSLVTHNTQKLSDKSNVLESLEKSDFSSIISNHFTELHYDAWSNFNATIDYVSYTDITYGKQLLGSLFFFIPRSIWEAKPIGSGQLLAENFLSVRFGFDFSNLSASMPTEGYINFGVLGVILFSVVFGYVYARLKTTMKVNLYHFYLVIYISFFLFFILRGDLLNSVAYSTGALCAFYSVYYFNQIVSKIFR